jgi:hypothetical protein
MLLRSQQAARRLGTSPIDRDIPVTPGMTIDPISRAELASRWAYRASLEVIAAKRFERLTHRARAGNFAELLYGQTAEAAGQEHHHISLCMQIAERFGHVRSRSGMQQSEVLPEIAPASFDDRARVLYEIVAFCCIAESANAAVVLLGADDVEDVDIRKSVRTILSDEVSHSQIGWQFLASYELTNKERAWLGAYLPDMLRGTVREDLFAPAPIIGDEYTMQKFGTLPIADRRQTFLDCMHEVVFPGLTAVGIDVSLGVDAVNKLAALQVEL